MTLDVKNLGQVFTPEHIVTEMLLLRKNFGSILEPSSGDGAFIKRLERTAIGIELDSTKYFDERILNIDFFDYDLKNKFDTIIGNPPYVRFQDILFETAFKLDISFFDKRTNLYQFFIKKAIDHLNDRGELIFITPKEFLKATSAHNLNEYIYNNGTITDIIDYGDKPIFKGFSPNVIVFRFEKGNFSRTTNLYKKFICADGQLYFIDNNYSIKFSNLFFVKVGAVSGCDEIFESEEYGNCDFVCSFTNKTGKTRKMIYNLKHSYLERFKDKLIKRKIKEFHENNWWEWGRKHFDIDLPRIYVNSKTRNTKPFFSHSSKYYDGSVLAIFPKFPVENLNLIVNKLNSVNWEELGFVTDGRFIFSQKSLENSLLPNCFNLFCKIPHE